MSTSEDLANRIREAFLNGKWIANTNYKLLLAGINREQALRKFGALNSIASLTYHINYYLDGLLVVFNGGDLTIKDKFSFALPSLNSEEDWIDLKTVLLKNAESLAQKVSLMPEEKLDSPFVRPEYGTYRRNVEGVLEHSYYHLGQISLLIRLFSTS